MEHAQARRPRADEDISRDLAPTLRAVPDDLSAAERRDWQALAERRHRRERTERSAPVRRRPARPVGTRPVAPERRAAPVSASDPRGAGAPPAPRPPAARLPGPAPRPPERTPGDPARSAAGRVALRGRPTASRGSSPDRLALWAVVLCLFMALVAAATARGDAPGPDERGADSAPAAVQPRD